MGSLRQWRELNGLRQQDVADKIQENRATYAKWENGQPPPPPQVRKKLIAIGFDGEFPEGNGEVTQEHLQALGRDLVRLVDHAHEDLKREIQKLGAVLQEILKRLPPQ